MFLLTDWIKIVPRNCTANQEQLARAKLGVDDVHDLLLDDRVLLRVLRIRRRCNAGQGADILPSGN